MSESPESVQLRTAELTLIRKFEGRIPSQQVTREFNAAAKDFAAAKVRTFVPILIERAVTERLTRAG